MYNNYEIFHVVEGHFCKVGTCAGTDSIDAVKRYVYRVEKACDEQGHKMSDTNFRNYCAKKISHRT